jgi:hypothetical protein
VHFWADIPPEFLAIAFVVAVGALLAGAEVIADIRHGWASMPLSEREARDLQRDQFRAEGRRQIADFQRRLGFRRGA